MVERIGGNTQFQQELSQPQARAGGAEGQYQGRHVSQKVNISSLAADAAEEMSFGAWEKVEKKLSERKLGKKGGLKSTAMEQAENYLQKMPDLGDKKRLIQFCEQLKKMADQSQQQLRQEAGKFSKDVSHQFAALSFAYDTVEDKGLKQKLQAALNQLMKEHGPAVKAGMNISETAARFAENGLGELGHLRDYYRETVLEHEGLKESYEHILGNINYYICSKCNHTTKKKPVDGCAVCGAPGEDFTYNEAEFMKHVGFLLKSVSSDLESKGPSLESSQLKKVMDDLFLVEVLGNMHRNSGALLAKIRREFQGAKNSYPPDLIQNILTGIEQKWVRPEYVGKLVSTLGVRDIVGQIYFIREFKELVRLIPLKAYSDPDQRENLLAGIQEALDAAINREEDAL